MSTVIVNLLLALGVLIAVVVVLPMLLGWALIGGTVLVERIRDRRHEHCACGRFDLSPTPEMSHVAAVIHCHTRHERDRCAPELEVL